MKKLSRVLVLLSLVQVCFLPLALANHDKPSLKEVFRTSGFKQPESAVYDAKRKVIYVSNVNGDPFKKDGNGFISRLSTKGKMLEAEWVKGLDAPKGLGIQGDSLFVADIGRIVEIDIASAVIKKSYPIPASKFLNDIAANDSHVFVSDMMASKIYSLSKQAVFEIVELPGKLDAPNGLALTGGKLVIASWGNPTNGFKTKVPGHVRLFDPATEKLIDFGGGKPLGNLDGIESDGEGGFWITDWMKGEIFHLCPCGSEDFRMNLGTGAADLGRIAKKKMLIVPLMGKDEVVGLKVR